METAVAMTGMGLGLAAGFLLRGALGGVDRRRLRSFVSNAADRLACGATVPERASDQITAALAADPELGHLEFRVVMVRIGHVELHGWVPSRRASLRALRVARAAAPGTEITNRLMVRGEDDHPNEPTTTEERQPA